MKALVAIAYYGTNNRAHLMQLIDEYRSMSLDVDVVVVTDREKDLPASIEQVIGTPARNPRSLPFAHKRVLASRRSSYDLFIYSEDDTLVAERNIDAFLWASDVLPPDKLAGFLRWERLPEGEASCSSVHNHFHWLPHSAFAVDGEHFAQFSNLHSACYMMQRHHLERALTSGAYLRPPRSGRYGMLETAATDVYTGCGMTKVICLSRLDDFLLQHLSSKYVGRLGLPLREVRVQVDALLGTLTGDVPTSQLLGPTKPLDDARWDKRFYEPVDHDVLGAVPASARRVLVLGTGSGELELALGAAGHETVGIPLDAVIGAVAGRRGVPVTRPSVAGALEDVAGLEFDALVAVDVLHHFKDPVSVLREVRGALRPGGAVVATVPNFRRELARGLAGRAAAPVPRGTFEDLGAHLVGPSTVATWLRRAGFVDVRVDGPGSIGRAGAAALSRALGAKRRMVTGRAAEVRSARPRRGPGGPRVSVGLPVHDGEKYLEDALESLLAQDFDDFEVVISDNASQDGTEEICRAFASRDARVSYHRQVANLGAAANYNATFLESRGEFFCWLAHDDVRHPSFLSACVEAFDSAAENVVLVQPRAYFIDSTGQVTHPDGDDLATGSPLTPLRLGRVLARVNMANAVFGLIRSSALEQSRLIGPFIASDYVLLVELAMLGSIIEVPEVLMYRRLHDASSRRANVTDDEVQRWFDVAATTPHTSVKRRLLDEYCRSVLDQSMVPPERAACLATIPTVMGTRLARNAIGRWRRRAAAGWSGR
ncbi:MAG: glycosyltransferase [Acidimicrobiia bacterium]|nr:glycosyltransferase [Acidimicrobiia bacterium]